MNFFGRICGSEDAEDTLLFGYRFDLLIVMARRNSFLFACNTAQTTQNAMIGEIGGRNCSLYDDSNSVTSRF